MFFNYLVGCRDDDILIRFGLKQSGLKEYGLDKATCATIKNSGHWKKPELQPPGQNTSDTWSNYCKSLFTKGFSDNIHIFPCGKTCGFCNG